MNNATTPQRFKRSPTTDTTEHRFELGQVVRLNNGLAPSGNVYRITAKLPPVGQSPQYRIQNEVEKFERVATQASLEAVGEAAAAAQPQSLLSPQVQAAIRAGAGVLPVD